MSTNKAVTFSSMLNEWLVNDLFEQAFKDQSWLWNEASVVKTWQGGKLIVPFQDHYANSVAMGQLSDDADLSSAGYTRGFLDGYKECYGSIVFNSRDLQYDHYRISEQSFISLLPQQLQQLMKFMRQTVSIQLLNGGRLDGVASGFVGDATGSVTVLHPERFQRTMKVVLVDTTGPTTVTGYVESINRSTGELFIYDARTGGSAEDLTGLDDTTDIYIDGGNTTSFGSLKDMLLPAANGGSDSYANVTKLASTFSQPILYDAGGSTGLGPDWNTGTAVTGNDILTLIFDAYRKNLQRGGEGDTAIMSYKHYSACMLALEKGSGGFRHTDMSVKYAGYNKIEVFGVVGMITLMGIREMDDDYIGLIKMKDMKFYCGNKPFQALESPEGLKYFTKRATTGYQYISDIGLVGDFLYTNPWNATSIYNIPNYEITGIT